MPAQTIREIYHNVNYGNPSSSVNVPGTILYPVGYAAYDVKTPVVFVHGYTGKLTSSYEANISAVRDYHLHAAFVQLPPTASPEENGKLLKKMIDRITAHFGSATVSLVVHSKGGMDSERALYGRNPYDNSIPSFGYEKVDAVYTFGSPLNGSRVADVGAALSWTGIAWIAMWYANAFDLTSASVQEFHNWAQSWRINSNGTFRNYYNPGGASYSRINMIEDNTTRWWAHQSDDPCYQDKWYFCIVGNGFHHSAGAYYDAYWEWDWFNSGWRNWHTENDGFIAVYRAQRRVLQNASPALTPGAGDSNYITMHDANHTSLWDAGEGHFRREVAPYLHYGLYSGAYRPAQEQDNTKENTTADLNVLENPVYISNGMFYIARNGKTEIIVENTPSEMTLAVWADRPVSRLTLTGNGQKTGLKSLEQPAYDDVKRAYASVFELEGLQAGTYRLDLGSQTDALVMVYNENPEVAFAVKWNWNEKTGYTGRPVEVKIAGLDKESLAKLRIEAELTLVAVHGKPVNPGKQILMHPQVSQIKDSHYQIDLGNLTPGNRYALRIKALLTDGTQLLARNAINTFYVPEDFPVKTVSARNDSDDKPFENESGFIMFPNPAENFVNLEMQPGTKEIIISDMSGKIVLMKNTKALFESLDISNLESGHYLVKIISGKGTSIRKLIKR